MEFFIAEAIDRPEKKLYSFRAFFKFMRSIAVDSFSHSVEAFPQASQVQKILNDVSPGNRQKAACGGRRQGREAFSFFLPRGKSGECGLLCAAVRTLFWLPAAGASFPAVAAG
jgi:hypothetical protein